MNLSIKLFLVACLAVGLIYFLYWEAGERFCSRLCPGNTVFSRRFAKAGGYKWCYLVRDEGAEIAINRTPGRTVIPDPTGHLQIPSAIGGIPVTRLGMYSLAWYLHLESVDIPSPVASIENYAFAGCCNLKVVSIPETVTNIATSAFAPHRAINVDSRNPCFCSIDGVLYDRKLTQILICPREKKSVTIPSSVTNIGAFAFHDCCQLEEITIPASVRTIGAFAFGETIRLRRMRFLGDAPECAKNGIFDLVHCLPIILVDETSKGWRGNCTNEVLWQGCAVQFVGKSENQ